MIFAFILTITSYLMIIYYTLMPSWRLPSEFLYPLENFTQFIALLNGFIPIQEMFSIIIIVIIFESSLFLTKFLLGFLSILRGGGKVDID